MKFIRIIYDDKEKAEKAASVLRICFPEIGWVAPFSSPRDGIIMDDNCVGGLCIGKMSTDKDRECALLRAKDCPVSYVSQWDFASPDDAREVYAKAGGLAYTALNPPEYDPYQFTPYDLGDWLEGWEDL